MQSGHSYVFPDESLFVANVASLQITLEKHKQNGKFMVEDLIPLSVMLSVIFTKTILGITFSMLTYNSVCALRERHEQSQVVGRVIPIGKDGILRARGYICLAPVLV